MRKAFEDIKLIFELAQSVCPVSESLHQALIKLVHEADTLSDEEIDTINFRKDCYYGYRKNGIETEK